MVRGLRADVTWSPIDDRFYQAEPSRSGVAGFAGFPISPDTANRVSAVWACNSLIAETIASLPCILYRRLDNGGKERAKDHPLYRTLRYQPNGWMTSADFFGFGQGHVGMRGNVINEIREGRDGIELVPHHPRNVTIEQLASGRMRYRVIDPAGGTPRTLLQDEVLHVRDLTTDGFTGVARSVLAREAIAVAAAGEAFVGGFFRNDATGRVVLEHPGPAVPDKEKRKELRDDIAQQYSGWKNTRKPMILYGGMKASELGKQEDSNFIIDPRNFQVADIARFWRVPLFMIGLEEKSTTWGSGLEQQKQGFVDFTVRIHTTRWEQAMARDLLSPEEQDEYFFEFLYADLLRGDLKSRSEALALQKDHGVINPNEWRIIENMNPREGGDEYQATPSGAAPAPAQRASSSSAVDQPDAVPVARAQLAPLLEDVAGRIAAAELRELKPRTLKRAEDPARFDGWCRSFYAGQRTYTGRVLEPIAQAFALDPLRVELAVARVEQSGLAFVAEAPTDAPLAEYRKAELVELLSTTLAPTPGRSHS